MSETHLSTYLNDHLGGSVAALELLDHLGRVCADSAVGRIAAELKPEIRQDREQLERLISELGLDRSRTRAAVAWLSEKMTELKLRLDDPLNGTLRAFEALELVAIGIHGKHALWTALRTIADSVPKLRTLDYDRLIERAQHQRRRLEAVRLDAVREALAPEPSSVPS